MNDLPIHNQYLDVQANHNHFDFIGTMEQYQQNLQASRILTIEL